MVAKSSGPLLARMPLNPLSPNSDENEISLYIITTCSKHSSGENKESDHQGLTLLTSFHNERMEKSKENMHFYTRALGVNI